MCIYILDFILYICYLVQSRSWKSVDTNLSNIKKYKVGFIFVDSDFVHISGAKPTEPMEGSSHSSTGSRFNIFVNPVIHDDYLEDLGELCGLFGLLRSPRINYHTGLAY